MNIKIIFTAAVFALTSIGCMATTSMRTEDHDTIQKQAELIRQKDAELAAVKDARADALRDSPQAQPQPTPATAQAEPFYQPPAQQAPMATSNMSGLLGDPNVCNLPMAYPKVVYLGDDASQVKTCGKSCYTFRPNMYDEQLESNIFFQVDGAWTTVCAGGMALRSNVKLPGKTTWDQLSVAPHDRKTFNIMLGTGTHTVTAYTCRWQAGPSGQVCVVTAVGEKSINMNDWQKASNVTAMGPWMIVR